MDGKAINNGNGIEFTIMYNNEKVTFKATLVEHISWIHNVKGKLEIIYISNCKRYYTEDIYLGGVTKFGASFVYPMVTKSFFEKYEAILTDDIVLMEQLFEAENKYATDEKIKFDQLQFERVEKINELPTTFKTDIPGFTFRRDKATYNPAYSKSIRGARITLENNNRTYYIDHYVTKDGKKRIKDFTRTFAKHIEDKDARELLNSLIEQKKKIIAMIQNIKFSKDC